MKFFTNIFLIYTIFKKSFFYQKDFLTKLIAIIYFSISSTIPFSAWAEESFNSYLSVFDDQKKVKKFTNFDYVDKNAVKGGEIKFGVEGTFNNLSPFILKGISAAGLSFTFDSLMVSSDDEIGVYYPLIADGVKLAKDKKSISFRISPLARFHDGKKITADDVVFTFKTLISEGHPSYKIAYRDVDNVVKISENKVRFNFKTNQNRDLPSMIASMEILPRHFFKDKKFSATTSSPILGSGPYRVEKVDSAKSISLVRVKDYWAKDLAVNVGRFNFDRMTYDYYRDNSILIEAFKGQKYDFRQENIARNWANSYNIDAIKNSEIIKKEIKNNLPVAIQAFIFNLRKEKFQNIALRKALNIAFDFNWLNKNIFYSSYKRTQSYFENSEYSYQKDFLTKSLFYEENGFNRKNLIRASEILKKAGYKIIDKKLIDPNSKKAVEIEFLIDSPSFLMAISPFVKNLKKLGIAAKIRMTEENQYQTRINNFDYDIIVAVFPQAIIPGNELFAYFHSSQKNIKGSRNLIGLANVKVDKLVEAIAKSKNKKELIKLCRQLDEILLKNYFTILQWHSNNYRILYRNKFEIPKKTPKYSIGLDSWYNINSYL
jgi:microcin C transport system substrate-binding protein